MDSPNEYDEEQYARWSQELHNAVAGLWLAGATRQNVEDEFRNALEDVGYSESD